MKRFLPWIAAATVFLAGTVAIREHALLIRTGYRLSREEANRDGLLVDAQRARDRLERRRSPAYLVRTAREMGLPAEYPAAYPVELLTKEGPRRTAGAEVAALVREP